MTQANDVSSIRAGWMIQIRGHGLVAPEPRALDLGLTLQGQRLRFVFEVAEKPANQPIRLGMPLYAIRGGTIASNSEEPSESGGWIVVTVSRLFPVASDLAERFHADADSAIAEVRALLQHLVRQELRGVADVAAGVLALTLVTSRPSFWNEAAIYWHGENQYKAGSTSSTVEMLSPTEFTKEQLLVLASEAGAALTAEPRTRRTLELCFRWLMHAHGLPHGSNERFTTLFQCLEALAGLVDNQPTAADAEGFAAIEALVDAESPAGKYLASMKGRILQPSLAERFARLSRRYRPASAVADQQEFREVRWARNQLLHAALVEVPGVRNGVPIHEAAQELVVGYLLALIADEKAQAKQELIVTRGLQGSEGQ